MSNLAYEEFRESQSTERIGGKIVSMSPASFSHNRIVYNLMRDMDDFFWDKDCLVMSDNHNLFLTEDDQFIPDLMVVCDRKKVRENGVYGAPDLVVEVLSPSTEKNDRGRKMRAYESAHVGEYWLIDGRAKKIEQYVLRGGRFDLAGLYFLHPALETEQVSEDGDEEIFLQSHVFPELQIPLSRVFARMLNEE